MEDILLADIKKELNDFESETIDIIDGLPFSQQELIKKIIYYYNSKFLSGDSDDQGDRKFFFNICKNPCDVCEKAIDFDTKNIKILTAPGGNPLKTWYFERDLKYWMKDQRFGKVLNRIFHELPIFGSVVLKIINGKPYFVDLRNFAVQQDADTLTDASYIIEKHTYKPLQFKRIAIEKGWNNWKKALGDKKQLVVLERYGADNDLNYRRTIVADNGEGTILADDKIDKHPYWEFHLDKLAGRWLGVGRVELTLDPQVRINQINNQQVKSSYWSSLQLWQSRDTGLKRNLLTDAQNGEVLQVEDEIKKVDMIDRNQTYYQLEIDRWQGNVDRNTFSREAIRGETEAGRTLGAVQLAAGMAGAHFSQIQENIAGDIKELLATVIIPQFAKESTKAHTLRLVGEDLETFNQMLIDIKTNNEILRYIGKGKGIPSSEQLELIRGIISEKIKKGKEKQSKLPEGFYKDFKYGIDIVITGEQMDIRTLNANRVALLQAMTTDPTLLTDPRKKKIIEPMLEASGINLADIDIEEQPQLQQIIQRGGGGVSKPTMPVSPVAGTSQQQI